MNFKGNFFQFLVVISLISIVFSYETEELDLIPNLIGRNQQIKDKFMNGLVDIIEQEDHKDSIICKVCLKTEQKVQDYLLKLNFDKVENLIASICSIGLKEEVCKGAIKKYGQSLIYGVIERYASPQFICTKIKICTPHYKVLNHTEFAENLLKEERIYHKGEPKQTNETLIHVTDMHIDPEYTEGTVANCDEPLCCRKDSKPKNAFLKTEINKAGKYGYPANCDTPIPTFNSMVDEVMKSNPSIIILTGDNPVHNVWKSTVDDALKTTKLIVDTFMEKISTLEIKPFIYPILGNHEAGNVDNVNLKNSTFVNEFYSNYSKIYKPFLEHDPEALDSFTKRGYYSIKHNNTDLRIIGLDSFDCDIFNFYLIQNDTDSGNMFVWLENELRKAEKNNEIVYLMGHIYPGNNFYLSQCSYRYKALNDRFSHIIRGQFFGHSHDDKIKVTTPYFSKSTRNNLILIAPSVTTYGSRHPSFRQIFYNNGNFDLIDYNQYRLNITKANEEDKINWEISYKFTEFYKVNNLTDYDGIYKKVITLGEDLEFTKKMIFETGAWGAKPEILNFSEKSTIGGKVISILYDLFSKNIDKKEQSIEQIGKSLRCDFTEEIYDNYMKCVKKLDFVTALIEFIDGEWFTTIDN